MANKARTVQQEKETIKTVQEVPAFEKLMAYYETNQKRINTATTVILVVVLGYLGYTKLYQAPQEEKAATAIEYAQRYFSVDSLNKALNGDGQHQGFLQLEKKYSGTKVANISHYYAGVCYLRKGDMNNAIKQLNDFDGKGTSIAYVAWGLLGDAYMETNNSKKALEYYIKAIGNKDDKLTTPTYLYRAGVVSEMNNKPEDAKKMYMRIRDEYPRSPQARDVVKDLARLGVLD